MSNTFRHTRDFRQSRTYVVVRGVGSECVGGTFVNGVCVGGTATLVHAVYNAHADEYVCRYLPNGWGGDPYFNADIGTLAQAAQVAEAIGARAWGALGQLSWRTDGVARDSTAITEFAEGDLIELDDPVEGQDNAVYSILEVNPVSESVGHPVWELVVGEQAPDIVDIINQITAVTRVQQARQEAGGGTDVTLGPGGVPGTPKSVPVTRAPTHSQQNVMQAATPTVIAQTYKPPFQDPAAPPVTGTAAQTQWTDGTGARGTHMSGDDGRPHPQLYAFTFTADGTSDPVVLHWDCTITKLRLKGTGSVVLNRNGSAVTSAITGDGVHTVGPISYSEADNDDLSVTASGVSGPFAVTVVEY